MRFRYATLLGASLTITVATGDATIFVPMSVEDLTRNSTAIVIGTVASVDGEEAGGKIYTLVTLTVEEDLKGTASALLTIKEKGGIAGNRRQTVFGTPEFQVGERVLLFLTQRSDGSWRTNQMALGKFRIETTAVGTVHAVQSFGPGTTVLVSRNTAPPPGALLLDDLLATVRRAL